MIFSYPLFFWEYSRYENVPMKDIIADILRIVSLDDPSSAVIISNWDVGDNIRVSIKSDVKTLLDSILANISDWKFEDIDSNIVEVFEMECEFILRWIHKMPSEVNTIDFFFTDNITVIPYITK